PGADDGEGLPGQAPLGQLRAPRHQYRRRAVDDGDVRRDVADRLQVTDPIAAGELTRAAKLSPAATTTVIDRLERAGFVARSRDAANRRRVLVAATEAARAAEREVYKPVGEAGTAALRRYDEDQLALIAGFLETARLVQEDQTARLKERA
ncbi:MAG TPA: MarR family transcriptional regulator, partial [Streptomyces sp.]|nr:MarR family transcriptional regulator [Streptomyces sp.]